MATKKRQRGATKEQLAKRAGRLGLRCAKTATGPSALPSGGKTSGRCVRKAGHAPPCGLEPEDRGLGDDVRPAAQDVEPRLYAFHADSQPARSARMARRAAELVKGTSAKVTLDTLVDPETAIDGAVALLRLAGLKVTVARQRYAAAILVEQ